MTTNHGFGERSSLPADPARLASLALEVAVAAAELVRDRRGRDFSIDTKSTSTDMVTEVDRASDALIRELLATARPDDGIVTEEDSETTGTSGVVWIADPIDGTTNFVYDHRPYLISIAATVGGDPVAGAVVEVCADDRYHASLGGGSFMNGTRLHLPDPPPLAHALVATGFGYSPERRTRQAAVVARMIGAIRDIRRVGAASHDLCSVAAGRVDAYYEHGLGPWDLAAGQLIVTEAGGVVEAVAGGRPDPALGIIAGHRDLVPALRELLHESGIDHVLA